jgi:hypothetical protein
MRNLIIAGALSLLPLGFVQAASADYFLKLEGVEGESSATAAQASLTVAGSIAIESGAAKVGQTVILDATQSADDSTISRFVWKQTGGPVVTLANAATAKASFVPTQAGTYVFELTTTDVNGRTTLERSVTVAVTSQTGGGTSGTVKTETAEPQKGNVEYEWKVEEGETAPAVEVDDIDYEDGDEPLTPDFSILLGGGTNEQLEILGKPEVQAAIYVVVPSSGGNVTAGGSQQKGGNVEFEWNVEEGESAASADFFLKLPPVEGESGEKGGTEDINIGVGEWQEGASKELVVVGAHVRGWDAETKQAIVAAAPTKASDVKTEADLALFAAAAVADDMPMEEVAFNYGKIVVKYQAQGKLLWFIPHSFVETATLDTDADGKARVQVKLPWYRFLLAPEVSAEEIEEEATGADDKHKEWIDVLSVGAGASVETQAAAHARAFSALSNVLKTKHDTAKNSISNIR